MKNIRIVFTPEEFEALREHTVRSADHISEKAIAMGEHRSLLETNPPLAKAFTKIIQKHLAKVLEP